MLNRTYLGIIAFIFLISCNSNVSKPKMNSGKIKTIPVDVHRIFKQKTSIYNHLTAIPLETKKHLMIGQISKLEIFDHKFFIHDNKLKCIWIFSDKGDYINHIQSIGRGPGEFVTITDFSIHKKKKMLGILDMGSMKFLEFGINGEFISEEKLSFYANKFCYTNTNDRIFFADNYLNFENDIKINDNIFILDDSEKLIEKGIPINKMLIGIHIDGYKVFNECDSSISINIPFNDTIYHYHHGRINPKYYINFGEHQLSPKDLPDMTKDPRSGFEILTTKYAFNPSNFCENNAHLIFQYIFKGNVYDLIYDKLSKKSFIVKDKRGDMFNGIIGQPLMVSDDFFYSSVEPYDLIQLAKKNEGPIYDLAKSLRSTDNPVIIKYKFKKNLN